MKRVLSLPDVITRGDTLSYVPGCPHKSNQVTLALTRLLNQRRRVASELSAETIEAMITQVAEDLGFWLTNSLAPDPVWPTSPTADARRTERFAELPEEIQQALRDTAQWLWRDQPDPNS